MEKLCIFPYNSDTEILLQNQAICRNFKITALASYKEDSDRLNKVKNHYKIICDTDFGYCCSLVDSVLFADNTMGNSLEGYSKRVELAHAHNNKIYMSSLLVNKLNLMNKIGEYRIFILDRLDLNDENLFMKEKEIIAPVITVLGCGENCDKFYLQVEAKKSLEQLGFNVLAVCSNSMGSFLDMEIFPEYFYSKKHSLTEKILVFNHWIVQMEMERKPDVIIIGCPGGIMPLNELCTNFYGELSLIVTNAIVCDMGILSLYQRFEHTNAELEKLKQMCQMRYNVPIDDFFISSRYFISNYEAQIIEYYDDNKESIEIINKHDNQDIRVSPFRIWNLLDAHSITENIERMLIVLQNNVFSI